MIAFAITALSSGSGKTVLTSAFLQALSDRGRSPCAFKCGPDYVDPVYHRSIPGVTCHNLDLFLNTEQGVRRLFARSVQGYDAAVAEGVMGYYDGIMGADTNGSTYHIAKTLGLPVLLVADGKQGAMSLCAQISGMLSFRKDAGIRAVFCNRCSEAAFPALRAAIEKECGLPVIGYLPESPEASIGSRHLGLLSAGETAEWETRRQLLGSQLAAHTDFEALEELFSYAPAETEMTSSARRPVCRIAVSRDKAFSFCYEETLDTLAEAGAEIVPFSPLHDSALPKDCGALYLTGGYPELHAEALAQNEAMRKAVSEAVKGGMPTVAEGGGFLYLLMSLTDARGETYPMAGVFPGNAKNASKPVRFGYAYLTAKENSLLFAQEDRVPVHSFHYWDTAETGSAFTVEKPSGKRRWESGYASGTMYAAFEQLYFAGVPQAALSFVQAAMAYRENA